MAVTPGAPALAVSALSLQSALKCHGLPPPHRVTWNRLLLSPASPLARSPAPRALRACARRLEPPRGDFRERRHHRVRLRRCGPDRGHIHRLPHWPGGPEEAVPEQDGRGGDALPGRMQELRGRRALLRTSRRCFPLQSVFWVRGIGAMAARVRTPIASGGAREAIETAWLLNSSCTEKCRAHHHACGDR